MAVLSVLAGAALLLWPSFLNGYPLVFSDTHAFLVQAGQPVMVWDKPWTYGPFLLAWHGDTTLWTPMVVQGLLLSHLLWLTQKVVAPPRPGAHLLLCAGLALGSAAPWFAAQLMPDIFAPMTVLCLFVLGFGDRLSRGERGWAAGLGVMAVAFHLSHLIIAAACLGVIALRRRWPALRAASVPLVGAVAILLLTNAIGHGRLGISPFGSVFALARLVADGPARAVIDRECPEAGWKLCAWKGKLPTDSDAFLWDGKGPAWAPHPRDLGAEASAILRRTVWTDPLGVLRAAMGNTLTQLRRVALGDTLGPDWLEGSITGSLRAWFPPAEMARFEASAQLQGRLAPWGRMLNPLHAALLLAGAAGTGFVLLRGAGPARGLAAMVLAGLLANAFATGALSGPHDRYQARIAWLLLLAPMVYAASRSTSAGDMRTSAS